MRITVSKKKVREALTCYLFLAPNMILFAVFFVYVLFSTFYTSFTNWVFVNPQKTFIGLENYINLFRDPYFHLALKNTFWVTASVPIGLAFSLLLAVLTNSKLVRWKSLFRTGFYAPVVVSMVVWAMVWRGIYSVNGLLNQLLGLFGVRGLDWLANLTWAFPAIIIMGKRQNAHTLTLSG